MVTHDGKETIVVLGADHVTGHDAVNGKELWRVGGLNPAGEQFFRSISSPVVANGIVVAPYARGKTITAIRLGGSGDVTKSHVLWTKTKGLPYIASAIVYRGQVVTVKDGGLVTAYDAKTGKDVYVQERAAAGGRYYASPVAANGHIYLATLDDGTITVLKAGVDKPEVVAQNPKLGEKVAATPAVADDTLYVRTDKHLYAFAAKK